MMTVEELLEELEAETNDIISDITDAVNTAATVESSRDFRANIGEALESARRLVEELERLRDLK